MISPAPASTTPTAPPARLIVGALVQIYDEDDPLRSDTTLLVAALLTLGVPPAGRDLFCATCEAVRGARQWRVQWSLRGGSEDGRFDAVKMQAAWADGAWLLQNPAHPLALLRGGLTYARAFGYTPRFTLAELAHLETPDTWLEAGIRNLVYLLREMPRAAAHARDIIRFGPRWAAFVPQDAPEAAKTRLLRYVESDENKRAKLRAA